MDPMTVTIVAALAAGALSGLGETDNTAKGRKHDA